MSNGIGNAVQAYKDTTINPAISSALLGTATFGAGTLGWNRLVETARSMFRRPASLMMMKMSPAEFDAEMEDIKNDEKLRWIIPGALGLGTLGLGLLASYRGNEEHGGLLSWNAKAKPLNTTYRGYAIPGTQNLSKSGALLKFASELTEYGGWVPSKEMADAYAKVVDAPYLSQTLFSNDPWMQNDLRTKCTGQAILIDAQNRAGSSNVSFGTIRDTARDKMQSKFNLMGVAGITAKTMFANTAADLFVNALGAMTGIPQNTREDLISAGTWYQAAKAILT